MGRHHLNSMQKKTFSTIFMKFYFKCIFSICIFYQKTTQAAKKAIPQMNQPEKCTENRTIVDYSDIESQARVPSNTQNCTDSMGPYSVKTRRYPKRNVIKTKQQRQNSRKPATVDQNVFAYL